MKIMIKTVNESNFSSQLNFDRVHDHDQEKEKGFTYRNQTKAKIGAVEGRNWK